MTDLTYTNDATLRRDDINPVYGKGDAANAKTITSTISLAGSASGTTVFLGRIPADARISGRSVIHHDDLATSGSPTLDLGIGSVNSNVTSDPDGLNDGIDVTSAGANVAVIKDHANYGKQAWEFVSGQTTNPGGELDVYGSIKDAATNAAGDITCELVYTLD